MVDVAARSTDVVATVTAWLEESWDPDLTVAQWWERLGTSGWGAPSWPEQWFGKGLSREESVRVQRAIADFGALGAPGGLGLLLAGPTIIDHGTDEQKEHYLRDIVTGQKAWCQLFSEPAAGSDLAGLQTRAAADGDEFVINGQKVWTSGGRVADLGMLVARTNPDAPKHQGLSYFAFDMHQPGVEIRPLREMTGRAMFNEVFLTDARAGAGTVIGGLNNGWAVANTTLGHERAGLGAGGGAEGGGVARPGTIAGDLERRAGDFVGRRKAVAAGENPGGMLSSAAAAITALARQTGRINDATVRQDLARLYTLGELGRMTNLRHKAARAAGGDIPGVGNLAKLSMSRILRLSRELGLQVLGAAGMLHGYNAEDAEAVATVTGLEGIGAVTELALFSPAPSIYGGTDEIQKNIIGERVLGLPKEPGPDKNTPFKDLLKN